VSVTAQRTVLAEIFAKVALILGAEAGLGYLEQLPGVEGMLFTVDEQTLFTTGFEQ
jgi:thiamine biosynthesis lipoprotein ApbE